MRKKCWRYVGVCLVVACFVGFSAAEELVICAKCGHESGEDAQFCGHCGSAFGEEDDDSGDATAVVSQTGGATTIVDHIDGSVVENDLKKASVYAARSRWWRALFYSENAMALNLCAKPNEDRKARVAKSLKKCRGKVASLGGGMKCGTCEGKGKIPAPLVVESLNGGTFEHKGMGLTCKVCHGAGRLPSKGSLSRQLSRYGKAKRYYAEARQGDGWVPLGDMWIPSDLEERLSFPQMAKMMRAVSGRCGGCLGFGAATCEACRGAGKAGCPDCKTGLNVRMAEGFDGVKDLKMSVKCETCAGNGWLSCRACRGRRSISCESCSGIGRTPFCEECHGKGLAKCGACSGKGSSEGKVCEECRGCGSVLCTSCDGSCRS